MLFHYILTVAALIAVASATVTAVEAFAQLPRCSLTCIISGFTNSACGISDLACSCTNFTLQAELTACIQTACSFTDQQQVAVVNDEICEGVPIESKERDVIIAGAVLVPLTLLCVALRCYSRYTFSKGLWWDDYTIILAAIILGGVLVVDLVNAFNGFGRHLWNIEPQEALLLLKLFWAAEILYIAVLTATKVSILLFYLKVFPSRAFRISALITLASVVAVGIAFTVILIFQCSPIRGVYDRTIQSTCLNLNVIAFSSSGLSIAQDLVILILPIPELGMLKMNIRKKLNLIFMFSIGSFACIISIIRLKYLVDFGNSIDPTFDNITPSIWSMAEISIAMICACLPAIRAILSRALPWVFDFTYSARSRSRSRSGPSLTSGISGFNVKVGPSWNKHSVTDGGADLEEIKMQCVNHKRGLTQAGVQQMVVGRGGKLVEAEDGEYEKEMTTLVGSESSGSADADKKLKETKLPIKDSNDPSSSSNLSSRPRRDESPAESEFSIIFGLEGPRESDEVEMIGLPGRPPTPPPKSPRVASFKGHVAATGSMGLKAASMMMGRGNKGDKKSESTSGSIAGGGEG